MKPKLAAPPPPPPAEDLAPDSFVSWAPGKTQRNTISPVSHPSVNHVVSANIAVKQMQSSLIDLYNSFQNYPMFNKDPKFRENNPEQYGESFEHGSDSFLSFMMNRYVNKQTPTQPQTKPNPKAAKPEQPTNLIQLVSSLKDLSKNKNAQGISVPDGIWGQMTTAALKNLYAITAAMLNLMTKLKIPSSNYTEADLANLKGLIAETNNPKAAQIITGNIARIKKLVGDFMHAMNSEQGKYSAYVRQEKPFNAGFGNKADYTAQDKVVFETAKAAKSTLFEIPQDIVIGKGSIPLDILSLSSKEGFNKFITDNRISVGGKDPIKDPAARDDLLNYIEQKIKTMGQSKNELTELPKGY